MGDHHGDVGAVSYSRERDVELTVGKYRGRRVDCDFWEGMPLVFVDPPKKKEKRTSKTPSRSPGSNLARFQPVFPQFGGQVSGGSSSGYERAAIKKEPSTSSPLPSYPQSLACLSRIYGTAHFI